MTQAIPLLIFTVFAGAAAGTVLCAAFCTPYGDASARAFVRKPAFFAVVCLALLCIGLLGTLGHLGQPLRFINGLSNPGSMIAQEGYWSIGLAVMLAIGCVMGLSRRIPRALMALGGVAAAGLMVVTSLAYALASGIPVWNGGLPFFVFFVGNTALGASLCAILLEKERSMLLNIAAVLAAASILVAIAFQMQAMAAHASFDLTPWTIAAAIIGGIVPMAVRAALAKGALDARMAAWLTFAAIAAGTVIMRLAFFAVGMPA